MSENHGHLPEWLRELGAKVDRLAESVAGLERTAAAQERTVAALGEATRSHQALLGDVIKSLDKLVDISHQHRQELDAQKEYIARLEGSR